MTFNILTGDLVLRKASYDVQHKELDQCVIFELGMLRPRGMNMDFSAFIQNWFLPWRRYNVLSYRKLGKETLLSTALVLLYSILSDHTATQPSHIWLNVLIELYVCALQNDPKQFSSMPSCTVPSFMLMNVSRFAFLSYLHRNTEFSLVEQLKLQCNVIRVHCFYSVLMKRGW